MTPQEKQLLLKDLCARLPYGVIINRRNDYTPSMEDIELNAYHLGAASYEFEYRGLRPYLRPMSSMTEEEKDELLNLRKEMNMHQHLWFDRVLDFYLSHHLDWRGLILLGLALKAPEGMYKTE